MMKIKKQILLEVFETNTYLIWDETEKVGVVIDPASKADKIMMDAEKNKFKIKYIINTHGHSDHIGANKELKKITDAPICIHELDATMLSDPQKNMSSFFVEKIISPPADILLHDHQNIQIGGIALKVIHTPGHTSGSICLLADNVLISGDTLFYEGFGRTDLPGGNAFILKKSINDKLFILPEKTKVYPGHGHLTTIEHEKLFNPILSI